jgi:hypothetical protein
MRQVAGFNPIHCLDWNLEVPPERLSLTADLAEEIASWDWEHGAIETLELASGEYEEWARLRLLDPASPTNAEGVGRSCGTPRSHPAVSSQMARRDNRHRHRAWANA